MANPLIPVGKNLLYAYIKVGRYLFMLPTDCFLVTFSYNFGNIIKIISGLKIKNLSFFRYALHRGTTEAIFVELREISSTFLNKKSLHRK